MADYHSPTVVQPFISEADMTPLERLILGLVFDEEGSDGTIYFHSWCGPSAIISVEAGELRAALEATMDTQSTAGRLVTALLDRHSAGEGADPHDYIDIDLTATDGGWDRIFQDVVRRSLSIDEIIVTESFTCTKMRPDRFGGGIMRITAEAIQYRSTIDMLEEMWNSPAPPGISDPGGHETRRRIEAIAGVAGWDSFTLLLVIARWLDRQGQIEALIDHLDRLASDEDV